MPTMVSMEVHVAQGYPQGAEDVGEGGVAWGEAGVVVAVAREAAGGGPGTRAPGGAGGGVEIEGGIGLMEAMADRAVVTGEAMEMTGKLVDEFGSIEGIMWLLSPPPGTRIVGEILALSTRTRESCCV